MNTLSIHAARPALSDFRTFRPLTRALPVAFAFLYALTLSQLPLDVFKDRENYFVYIFYSQEIFQRYTAGGVSSIIANEPIWLFFNMLLSRFLNPDNAMRVLIFIPAFIVSWQLLRRNLNHAIWMVVFLLSPQVVKNHIIHLRQGVAVAIFIFAYFSNSKWVRFSLMGVACLIHSSLFFICILGVGTWSLTKLRFSPRAQAAMFFLFFAFLGAVIELFAGGITSLAGQLGARQAITYADADLNISGIGFAFWGGVFLLFISSGDAFLRGNTFAISILAFYLVIYFLTPVAGRVFESGLFVVFLAALALPHPRRIIFLWGFASMALAQYYLRMSEPWLGFGLW